jgi:hypothetical protein
MVDLANRIVVERVRGLGERLYSVAYHPARKGVVAIGGKRTIELVNKLKQLGLLGDELLHTTNGKEYITKEQVRVEVEEALTEAGGRMPLVSPSRGDGIRGDKLCAL